MNIGIVTTWFERGAAYVSRAYRDVLATRHNVFIYARGGEHYAVGDPDWDKEYVSWGTLATVPQLTNINWAEFRRWIDYHELDVVIFNEQHYWDVILRCQELDIVIGAYVDYYTSRTVPYFWLYDFLLCNTRRHYDVFRTHPQAVYIPWGTDCAIYTPTADSNEDGTLRFFHSAGMGGINLRKGTDILVRAFQGVQGSARLIIHSQVGIERYGDVKDLIRKDPRITFLHVTVKPPGLYHLGDVYVYPTKLEGIGLSIPEALACGLPVITTSNPPMNEFVIEGLTGKLVSVSESHQRADDYYWPESICSESALTSAMQEYVDNRELLSQQKRQAREYAVNHLDWKVNARNLPNSIGQFSRLGRRSGILRRSIVTEEKRRIAEAHMGLTYGFYSQRDLSLVRHHLVRAIVSNPRFLRNAGVWSIAAEVFLGRRAANVLRCRLAGLKSVFK